MSRRTSSFERQQRPTSCEAPSSSSVSLLLTTLKSTTKGTSLASSIGISTAAARNGGSHAATTHSASAILTQTSTSGQTTWQSINPGCASIPRVGLPALTGSRA
eukprot:3423056-Prymnesium_polylepis.1